MPARPGDAEYRAQEQELGSDVRFDVGQFLVALADRVDKPSQHRVFQFEFAD